MTCDEVRDLLPELTLGTLDAATEAAARQHVRGCGGCRADVAALDRGLVAVTLLAPSVEPPPELQGQVLSALEEEWRSSGVAPDRPEAVPPRADRRVARDGGSRSRVPWLAAAAAFLAFLGAIAWGVTAVRDAEVRGQVADEIRLKADRYQALLGALGGENVRVGAMTPAPGVGLEGSVIAYDSTVGQNWVLGLVRAPRLRGTAVLVLKGPAGRLRLHPMELESDGSASAWLVTDRDLRGFDRLVLLGGDGSPLATGDLT